ncbi:MAG: hypothetical protein J6S58_09435, partial [Lentisphaeria bacterium]|nr:hypothetical protein [Lentisphaeria bacterium]
MKTVLYTCLFLAVGVLCSAEKVFTFERRLKTNDAFQCRILTDQSIRYSFQLRGREQPVTRLETIQASFNGYIQVLSLNEQGNASSIRIRMDMAHGSLNGKPLKVSSGKNILIRGDLSGRRSSFRREDGVALSSGETALLQALFPPASPLSLSDLTGKKRVLPLPGQSWKIVPDPFLHHLAERQIH